MEDLAFIGGIVKSIFGGGGTKQTQTADQKTNIEIENIIDMSALADAINAMGQSLNTTIKSGSEQTKALLAGLFVINASEAERRAKAQENIIAGLKLAAVAGAGWFIFRRVL